MVYNASTQMTKVVLYITGLHGRIIFVEVQILYYDPAVIVQVRFSAAICYCTVSVP